MRLAVVGVDISQEWFDVEIPSVKHKEQFPQTTAGFKLLLKRLKKHRITQARFCMEATGLYFEPLAEFLHANGHEVVVVNPQCIKAYSRSELRRSKSDPLDAKLIAAFCEEKYDKQHVWRPLPPHHKAVREILRRRQALVDFRTAEKNRLKAGFSCDSVLQSIRDSISRLDQQISDLEALAFGIIDKNPDLKRIVDLADTVGGIGRLTAAAVLVETPPELWSGRLAATYAGVAPCKNSSGKSASKSGISRVGSTRLRQVLYMPAVTAAHSNPLLKGFYERLLSRGLAKKQALTAVMRKLLHLIFGVLKTGQRFDPFYESHRRASMQHC